MSSVVYDVALATCNGHLFLEEQLESLRRQTWPMHRLVVIDDASTDGTPDMVIGWAKSADVALVLERHVSRSGCAATFSEAMILSDSEYVLLCDQDDIWDADHAEVLLGRLLDLEGVFGLETPLLVHSDLRLIDRTGVLCHRSFFRRQRLFPARVGLLDLAIQNVVTGCSVAVNRACIQEALPIPREAVMHDGWLALVASGLGCIAFVPKATLSYRQHGGNAVGARGFFRLLRGRGRLALSYDGRSQVVNELAAQVEQLRLLLAFYGPRLEGRLPCSVPLLLQYLEALADPRPWRRCWAAWRLHLRKHGWLRSLALYGLLLCRPVGRSGA